MKKRIVSILLILCMVLTMLPMTAMAMTIDDLIADDVVFNPYFYDARWLDLEDMSESELVAHYKSGGLSLQGRQASACFDPAWYVENIHGGISYEAAAYEYKSILDQFKPWNTVSIVGPNNYTRTSEHFDIVVFKHNYPGLAKGPNPVVRFEKDWHSTFAAQYTGDPAKWRPSGAEYLYLKFEPGCNDAKVSISRTSQYLADDCAYGYYGAGYSADGSNPSLPTATRPGYIFLGWYDSVEGKIVTATDTVHLRNTPGDPRAKTRTLYARWKANPTITFDANGGECTIDKQQMEYQKPYQLPDATQTTRTGYTFAGWWTAPVGGTEVTGETSVTNMENHILYAHWTPNQYKVSFNTNGGTKLGAMTVTYDAPYNASGFMPYTKRVGFEFEGWFMNEDLTDEVTADTIVKTPNDHTLHAKWDPIEYTVNYVNGTETVAYEEHSYGEQFSLPLAETLDMTAPANKHFVGWNTTSSDATVVVYADGQTITSGLTTEDGGEVNLYAVWADNDILRVIYNANGGSNAPSDTNEYYENDDVTIASGSPVRPGYTFEGWSLDSAAEEPDYMPGDIIAMGKDDLTLYAVWRANTYTITYDANGGNGTIEDQVCTYDVPAQLSDGTALTREGYEFRGWALSAGGGVAYAAALPVLNLTTAADAVFHLYAVWTPVPVTVSFDANGGFCAIGNYGYTYDEPYGMLPQPHWEGHVFDGWFTEADGGVQVTEADTASEEMTLYAHWTTKTYTVELVQGSNYTLTAVSTSPVEHGESFTFTVSVADTYDAEKIIVLANGTVLTGTGGTYTIENITADQTVRVFGLEKKSYPVTLYSFGTVLADLTSYVYGEGAVLPVPTKDGYTFLGWYENEDFSGNAVTEIAADATGAKVFYAKWEAETYAAVFDANGGEGTVTDDNTYAIGDTIMLPTGGVTKSGCELLGWNTDQDATYGETGAYTIEASDIENGTITFYAIWTEADNITYKVEHYLQNTDLNGYELAASETQTLAGTADAYVTATPKSFAGFTYNSTDSVYDGNIAEDGSLVLKLYYDRNTYAVSFEPDGGTVLGDLTEYVYGVGAQLPDAEKEGFAFGGWYAAPDLSGDVITEIGTDELGDKNFYAKWTAETCQVVFDANGGEGTVTDDNTYAIGDTIMLPTGGVTKSGCELLGWNTDQDATYGETGAYTIEASDIENGTITFYAIWTEADNITYKVEHYLQNTDLNGYELAASETQTLAGTADAYVTATPKSFAGFTYNSTESVYDGNIAEDGSLVLKLYYDRNTYAVSFEPDGGTVLGDLTEYVYGVGAQLPDAEKEGFAFGGWYAAPDLSGDVITEIGTDELGDKNFYAKWEENTNTTYLVEHYKQDLYGGYELLATDRKQGVTGEYTEAVARPGTAFVALPVEQQKIEADGSTVIKIYYERKSFQLTFDANGGEGGTTEQVLYEAPIQAPYVTREGWTFVGWTPVVEATMPAKDVTYTANWTQDTYTIVYDANGGTGSETQTVYVSQLPTLSDGADFARDGWTLEGWSTAGGEHNAVDYALGEELTTAPVEKDQIFKLYAVWSENTVTVTFDAGEGTVSPETMTFPENGTYSNLPIAQRDGYTFVGWFTEDDTQVTGGMSLVSDDDHTLYAKWATDVYTIVYHANGGEEADVSVNYALSGTPTLEGAIFTRDTYDHVGWATAPNGEIVYELGAVLGADLAHAGETVDLYAVWGIADVVVEGYTGVYDGCDHFLTYDLADRITVTGWQWYFKAEGESEFVPVDSDAYDSYAVREVADSGIYYCHVDGLEDEYYVVSFDTEQAFVSITARPITFTAGSAEKIYDGTPLTEEGYTYTEYGTDVGLCDGHTTQVTMTEESTITNVGQTPNEIDTVEIFDETGAEVTENYAITTLPGTLKVTPRDVKLVAEGELNALFGDDFSAIVDQLLELYDVDETTPLGEGDTFEDLLVSFEYSTDGGATFLPFDAAALEQMYEDNADGFIVRPVVNSTNYTLIDADTAQVTVTLTKTALWAKVRWYGSSRYTYSLSLGFYEADYDEETGEWIVDESHLVIPEGMDDLTYEIRDYATGEVIRSGDMVKRGSLFYAYYDKVGVQAQVFFEADGYIIRSF